MRKKRLPQKHRLFSSPHREKKLRTRTHARTNTKLEPKISYHTHTYMHTHIYIYIMNTWHMAHSLIFFLSSSWWCYIRSFVRFMIFFSAFIHNSHFEFPFPTLLYCMHCETVSCSCKLSQIGYWLVNNLCLTIYFRYIFTLLRIKSDCSFGNFCDSLGTLTVCVQCLSTYISICVFVCLFIHVMRIVDIEIVKLLVWLLCWPPQYTKSVKLFSVLFFFYSFVSFKQPTKLLANYSTNTTRDECKLSKSLK